MVCELTLVCVRHVSTHWKVSVTKLLVHQHQATSLNYLNWTFERWHGFLSSMRSLMWIKGSFRKHRLCRCHINMHWFCKDVKCFGVLLIFYLCCCLNCVRRYPLFPSVLLLVQDTTCLIRLMIYWIYLFRCQVHAFILLLLLVKWH